MCAARPLRTIFRQLQTTSIRRKIFQLKDKAEFTEKVISSKQPVVVDFHANWCAPCRELGPRLEAATEQAGLDLVKVDVDDLAELAMEYEVSAVPAVVGLAGGKVIDRFVGSQGDNEISRFIQNLIKSTQ